MSRGVKVSLSEKVELVEWLITGKGSQAAWARKQKRAPETVSRLFDDDEFKMLWAAAERAQEGRFAMVLEKAYEIAMDTDHMHWPQAVTILAKAFGKFKPEKIDLNVDRIAYVEPRALAALSIATHPELKN